MGFIGSVIQRLLMDLHLGVSENRGPQYSTLNSRILIIRTPKSVPLFSETPT